MFEKSPSQIFTFPQKVFRFGSSWSQKYMENTLAKQIFGLEFLLYDWTDYLCLVLIKSLIIIKVIGHGSVFHFFLGDIGECTVSQ
jgi:hypothetical protein